MKLHNYDLSLCLFTFDLDHKKVKVKNILTVDMSKMVTDRANINIKSHIGFRLTHLDLKLAHLVKITPIWTANISKSVTDRENVSIAIT